MGQRADKESVQNHSERIHVAADVDVLTCEVGLLRTEVLRRADNLPGLAGERLFHE
jgi:hypothetical protein